MRRVPIALISALLLAGFEPAAAQTPAGSAGDFADHCREITPLQARDEPALILMNGFCLGYLSGLIGSNRLFQDSGRGRPFFCVPDWVSPGQARLVFLRYMDEHPEKRQDNAGSIVIVSLMAAFPCESGK
jgi:hypothetical protein